MKTLKVWLIITTLIVFSLDANAQSFGRSGPRSRGDIGYLSIGGSVGIMNYFGDLNPLSQYVSTDIRSTRPSIGITVQRKFSPRLIVRGGLNWGRLTADDFKAADPNDERHRYRYIRNAHFRNDIYELSLTLTYDLIPSRFTYYRRAKWTPYVTAGVATFYHNPMAKTPIDSPYGSFDNKWVYLRPLSTEGQGLERSVDSPYPNGPKAGTSYGKKYSLIQFAIPVGFGVRFKLSDRWDLSAEIAYRILFTDYIDDVSGNYANPNDLPSDLSRAMADRTQEGVAARNGADRSATRDALLAQLKYKNGEFAGFGNDGDKRGEPNNPDVYIFTGVHLTRIIGVGLRCPKFK